MKYFLATVTALTQIFFQLSDWDRFAADEYEQLVAEEGNTELIDDM